MRNNSFYWIRKLHGQMDQQRIEWRRRRGQRDLLRNASADTIFLVGTPIHPNIGDSAIVLAELAFLRSILPDSLRLVEITDDSLSRNTKLAWKSFRGTGKLPLLWHGGGNMGDLWIEQELLRRETLAALGQKRIISFPQTFFYSETEAGRQRAQASIPYYNGKAGLTLTARERKTYELLKSLYPETDIRLTPDIVLSSSAEEFGVRQIPRSGVLMCIRNDAEKSIGTDTWEAVKAALQQRGEQVRITDMGATDCYIITARNRAAVVREKMQEFRGAKLVVTDRLHGMVFAALTGTPCVVFSCNNHKVKSTYDWISYLPYIRYAERAEDALRVLPELLAMDNCKFDNTPLLPRYDSLKELILEACR